MPIKVATNPKVGHKLTFSLPHGLAPGASWDGTAGTGGAVPTESATLRGSGWPHKPAVMLDVPKVQFMHDDFAVTVVGGTGDPAGIEEVVFWMEGNTVTVTASEPSTRNGSIGFTANLDYSAFSGDGDALLYATVRPVNGYERLLGPITFTRMAEASRPVRYVDNVSGSDSDAGTSLALAYATVQKACTSAPSGAIVYCTSGTHLLDSNSGTLQNNARPIEFRPLSGVYGDVIFSRTSRTSPAAYFQARCKNMVWTKIMVDMAKIAYFWGASPTGSYVWGNEGVLEDTAGITGGYDTWPGVTDPVQIGYMIQQETVQQIFRSNEGQENVLISSRLTNHCTAGASLLIDTELENASDMSYMPLTNTATINTTATQQVPEFHQRRHLVHTVTVATVSYNAGVASGNDPDGNPYVGRTTLTFNESTTWDTVATGGQPMQNYQFLSGPLVGQEFPIYSQNSGGTVVLYGDASAAVVGNSARGYIVWHADSIQFGQQLVTGTNYDNHVFQRYRSVGFTSQILWQAGSFTGPGTVTTTGAALTCSTTHGLKLYDIVRLRSGSQNGEYRTVVSVDSTTTATLDSGFSVDQAATNWYQGKSVNNVILQACVTDKTDDDFDVFDQWQHGHNHVVYEGCTHVGQNLSMRSDSAGGFAVYDCVLRDCIFEGVTSPGTFPPSDRLIIDNNHFIDGVTRGTNAATGAVTFDADYEATGVTQTRSGDGLPYDWKARFLTGASKVGALG